jgi:inner membrane protein YidH
MANSVQSDEKRTTRPRRSLGEMRTMMAADRTLMAWIRTALSLLSFGFAIYKILQEVEQSGKALPSHTPRNVGLVFAVAGTAAMVIGTMEYWLNLRELRRDTHFRQLRPALIMALAMSVSGAILIFGILTSSF